MAITVELPPEMAKEAQDYVARCGTTIEQFLFDHLKDELLRRKRNSELVQLAGTWVDDPAMETAFAEMDRIDADLWK